MPRSWTERFARVAILLVLALGAGWAVTVVWALSAASASGAEIALGDGRTYLLHAPAKDAGTKRPLVVMLHGGGGNAADTARITGWNRKADAEGFVVAYGEAQALDPAKPARFMGNPRIWNDGSDLRDGADRMDGGPDDVAYVAALLDDVTRRVAVDATRVYLAGWSNGAAMAFVVAQRLGARIAAVAPFGGNLWTDGVALASPVPLLYVVGERDPLTPPAGGAVRRLARRPTEKPPTLDAAVAWAAALGCASPPVAATAWGWTARRWSGCARGGEVVYAIVPGHGHNWPGAPNRLPERLVGPNAPSTSATDAMWEFFRRHTRS